jgi:hypothetical protein
MAAVWEAAVPAARVIDMLSPHLQAHFALATQNDRLRRRRRWTR